MDYTVDAPARASRGTGQEILRQLKSFIARLGAAILAVPVVLMIHEFGHLLTAITLGFHNVRLHYESVSYADQNLFWELIQSGAKAQAAAVSPFWKVAVMEIAGPVVSLATLFIAARWVRRCWIAAVIGVVATWRFIAPVTVCLGEFSACPARHSPHATLGDGRV